MGIQMAFLGSKETSAITATSVVVSDINFGFSEVGVTFTNTGIEFTTIRGSNTVITTWVTPAGDATNWEIRATLDGGNTPNGTLGSWLSLTTSRTWDFSRSALGVSECFLTFEFRRVGGSVAEFTIPGNQLSAEVVSLFP
jgi:hypothetical protein